MYGIILCTVFIVSFGLVDGLFRPLKNLTACVGSTCHNGGQLHTETCTCVCTGSYYGHLCEKDRKPSQWPRGSYGLPAVMYGCPETADHGWRKGHVNVTLSGKHSSQQIWPETMRLLGPYHTRTFQLTVCARKDEDGDEDAGADWPDGSYCIVKLYGYECPAGFDQRTLPLLDYEIYNNDSSGWLPSYDVMDKGIEFHLCCKNASKPEVTMTFPTDHQFYFIQPDLPANCSEVNGMELIVESFTFLKLSPDNWTQAIGDLTVGETETVYSLNFCHYLPTAARECIYKEDGGMSYRGRANVTKNGTDCEPWEGRKPTKSTVYLGDFKKNYCLKYYYYDEAPECYSRGVYQECDIPYCDTTGEPENVALNKPVNSEPVRNLYYRHSVVDGNVGQPPIVIERPKLEPWIQIDLQSDYEISSVTIHKAKTYYPYNLRDLVVFVSTNQWDFFNNGAQICDGPWNPYRPKTFRFQCRQPIVGRYVTLVNFMQFHPRKGHNIYLTFELSEILVRAKDTGCGRPLGIGSGFIQDFQFEPSSFQNEMYPDFSRLYRSTGWCANKKDGEPYMQVDLITPTLIEGVVIQGWTEGATEYIPLGFSVYYGVRNDSMHLYRDNNITVFRTDNNVPVDTLQTFRFAEPFVARLVRIAIVDYQVKACLKFELIGCPKRVELDLKCNESSTLIGRQEMYGNSYYLELVGMNHTLVTDDIQVCIDACVAWYMECRACRFNSHRHECDLLTGDRYNRNELHWWVKTTTSSVYVQRMCIRDTEQKPITECGGNVTSLGILYSPSYPLYYGEAINCTWRILVPEGEYIRIDLMDVDLAVKDAASQNGQTSDSPELCSDKFAIHDPNLQETEIYSVSGKRLANPRARAISSSNELRVVLTSCYRTSETRARGFAIRISKSDCAGCGFGKAGCSSGAKCRTDCGYISSLNHPDLYEVSSTCSWEIQGVMGQYVVISFLQLDVIGSEECEGDFLTLYDIDLNNNRQMLGKYCKNRRLVKSISSNWHKMEVEFYSDFKDVGSGFLLKYELKNISFEDAATNNPDCRGDWYSFGESCYNFGVSDNPIDWTEANHICHLNDSHLVSINDVNEMKFLQETIILRRPFPKPKSYIGLQKIQTDNRDTTYMKWTDNKPVSYSAWYKDEGTGRRQPDGFDDERCSYMSISSIRSLQSWHDVACAYDQFDQFICEKEVTNSTWGQPSGMYLTTNSKPEKLTFYHKCGISGEYISSVYICDGKADCKDESDEDGCESECPNTMFKCDNGQCINLAFYCDFKPQCKDKSDENNCVYRSCNSSSEWTCTSGQCIPVESRCNLITDCDDASDETGCTSCSADGFQCYDGTCISSNRVCDGYTDCKGLYGEDEASTCTRTAHPSCGVWSAIGATQSGTYKLTVNGEIFEVECIFDNNKITTLIHHNVEDRVYVGQVDWETEFKYLASLTAISILKQNFTKCRQHVRFNCFYTWEIFKEGIFWYDVNSKRHDFINDDKSCSCVLKSNCDANNTMCRCDYPRYVWFPLDDNTWLTDNGYLDDKDLLPITKMFVERVTDNQLILVDVGALQCEEELQKKTDSLLCDNDVVVPSSTRCLLDYDIYNITTGCRDFSHLIGCESAVCPSDHFKCPDSYCLHIKNVCNGVPDCPNKEDESHCDDWNCDGYFRCSDSKVCLSWNEVCDGRRHCSNGADEMLCDYGCPTNCTCEGLNVRCDKFSNSTLSLLNTNTRYLNLKYSELSVDDLRFESLATLGFLDLSFTDLKHISQAMFENLHNLFHLDLSGNRLRVLSYGIFKDLKQLRFLNLNGNAELQRIEAGAFLGLGKLPILDLAYLNLQGLDQGTFRGLHSATAVNVSGNSIQYIQDAAFLTLGKCQVLDLRDNDVAEFSGTVFGGLPNLTYLYTELHTFCCLRPWTVPEENCWPKPDEFSSCADLMKNETLRVSMWVLGLIALVGNLFVLMYRATCETGGFKKSNGILVAHLSVADFIMGVYMLIIASADVFYRGRYSWNDSWWRNSPLCKAAGFLATFSSEASVMFLCIITLDRVIAIRFPFSRFKFTPTFATIMALLAWLLSFILAITPLLAKSYFQDQFYSRSGVCLGLPLTRKRSPGWEYAIGVFIVWNFICFVVIALGQAVIYHQIRESSLRFKRQSSSDMAVARKLSLIVMSDFTCWFPICVMGLMALQGHVISGEVYAWAAVFILPVNSAINPIIYTASSIQLTTLMKKLKRSSTLSSRSMRENTEVSEIRRITNDIRSSEMFHMDPPEDTEMLSEFLQRNLDLLLIKNIAVKVAESLALLHNNGFVFRDMNENNIYISVENGKVKKLRCMLLPTQFLDEEEAKHDVKNYGSLVSKMLKVYNMNKKKLEKQQQ